MVEIGICNPCIYVLKNILCKLQNIFTLANSVGKSFILTLAVKLFQSAAITPPDEMTIKIIK